MERCELTLPILGRSEVDFEGKDFDSSTELWDEEDVPKCPGCAIPLEVSWEINKVLRLKAYLYGDFPVILLTSSIGGQ